MAYGFQVNLSSGATVFDSEKVGKGSYIKSSGSIAFNSGLTYGQDEILVFKVSNFSTTTSSTNKAWVSSKTVVSGSNFVTTFYRLAGSTSYTTVDYLILDNLAAVTPTGTYGIQCIVPDGSGAIVTFDSRRFPNELGRFDVDANSVFNYAFGHGSTINSGTDSITTIYYSAAPLDYTSVTNYVRQFGFYFEKAGTSTTIFFAQSGFGNNLTGTSTGSVQICNEISSFGYTYPNSLQPYFYGEIQ